MMRDDDLSLLQELVSNAHAFAQQSARVLPQVENQAFKFTLLLQLIEGLGHFVLGGLLEARNVDVPDAGFDHEMNVNAIARNLVAHHVEVEGLVRTLTQHCDLDRGTFRPLEQLGNVAGAHVVGLLAVDGDDYVAGTNASTIGRSAGERGNHNDFVVARTYLHAHAVVLAALLLAERCVRFRIKEVRVRVEYPQHSRNGSVIDGLVRIHRLRVVLLHDFIHLGETAHAVANVAVTRRRRGSQALAKHHADTTTGKNDTNNEYSGATGTTGHYCFFLRLAGNLRSPLDPMPALKKYNTFAA